MATIELVMTIFNKKIGFILPDSLVPIDDILLLPDGLISFVIIIILL